MENIDFFFEKLGLKKEIGQKFFSEVNIINLLPGEKINEFGKIFQVYFCKEGFYVLFTLINQKRLLH